MQDRSFGNLLKSASLRTNCLSFASRSGRPQLIDITTTRAELPPCKVLEKQPRVAPIAAAIFKRGKDQDASTAYCDRIDRGPVFTSLLLPATRIQPGACLRARGSGQLRGSFFGMPPADGRGKAQFGWSVGLGRGWSGCGCCHCGRRRHCSRRRWRIRRSRGCIGDGRLAPVRSGRGSLATSEVEKEQKREGHSAGNGRMPHRTRLSGPWLGARFKEGTSRCGSDGAAALMKSGAAPAPDQGVACRDVSRRMEKAARCRAASLFRRIARDVSRSRPPSIPSPKEERKRAYFSTTLSLL